MQSYINYMYVIYIYIMYIQLNVTKNMYVYIYINYR